MIRLMALGLVVFITAAAGCSRTLPEETLTLGSLETVQTSELLACTDVCLARSETCTDTDTDAHCAAENARCVQSCARAESGRVYAFYCQAEVVTPRGLVLSDSSCVGAPGETLDEQRSSCERGFEPPSSAFAYTVNCRPVLTWANARLSGARQLFAPCARRTMSVRLGCRAA
jgi:hypothetical protein